MSRMSDLAVVLDSLAATANALKDSADALLRTAGQLRMLFSEAPEPAGPPQPRPKRTGRRPAPETKEEAPPAPEPETPEPEAYTKESVRALLAGLAAGGQREEAKALVEKYSGGRSFSDIDPARYPELAEEVKKIHG